MTQTDQGNAKRRSYPFLNTEFLFVTSFGCFGKELEDLRGEMCPISQINIAKGNRTIALALSCRNSRRIFAM
jgi:hypothetical protein